MESLKVAELYLSHPEGLGKTVNDYMDTRLKLSLSIGDELVSSVVDKKYLDCKLISI